jgi:SAM-dependent methyltransferase
MANIVNAAQAEAWNGYEGQHWATHAERYDAVNSGFNEILLGAAEIGDRDQVLDVGCGNGQLTRLAALRARLGHATGVDLSGPMLATARARAYCENIANVSFRQGDAQVYPFPEGCFDVALSRFGVMFFSDPISAFANIRRPLKPAGRLAFVCMTNFEGTDLGALFDAMSPYLPTPTGPADSGPTSLADPAHTSAVLAAAGFGSIGCTRVEADQIWGRDVADAAEFITSWGPVKYHLHHVAPKTAAQAREALTDALQMFAEPSGVRLRGKALLVIALAPDRGP